MVSLLLVWLAACSGSKDDSSGGGAGDDTSTPTDDSESGDDTGTSKDDSAGDDSGEDDSGKGDDSGSGDDSGCTELAWYLDGDLDGYGSGGANLSCDSPGTNWVGVAGDCDDSDPYVSPIATERCDGIDNDCDLLIDDDDDPVIGKGTGYLDLDGDGYAGTPFTACDLSATSPKNEDCDDGNPAVNFGADEVCNFFDDDCDGSADDADPSLVGAVWYPDDDGDGFGNPSGTITLGCTGITGMVADDTDCDDRDAAVYPGAPELCDYVQQNCDTKGWVGDVGVATFWDDATYTATDMTPTMAAGVYGAPATVTIADDGQLVICDGTWFVDIEIETYGARVTGLNGSAVTILSGGDVTRTIGVGADSPIVSLTGLTLTEGNGCYGAAISAMDVTACSAAGATASFNKDGVIALDDVHVVANNPTNYAVAAVYFGSRFSLSMANSTIAENGTVGLRAFDGYASCSGAAKSDAGIWGNVEGVIIESDSPTDEYTFKSYACDFDGATATSGDDVTLWNTAGSATSVSYDYGDDESFSCDATTLTCG